METPIPDLIAIRAQAEKRLRNKQLALQQQRDFHADAVLNLMRRVFYLKAEKIIEVLVENGSGFSFNLTEFLRDESVKELADVLRTALEACSVKLLDGLIERIGVPGEENWDYLLSIIVTKKFISRSTNPMDWCELDLVVSQHWIGKTDEPV